MNSATVPAAVIYKCGKGFSNDGNKIRETRILSRAETKDVERRSLEKLTQFIQNLHSIYTLLLISRQQTAESKNWQ